MLSLKRIFKNYGDTGSLNEQVSRTWEHSQPPRTHP
jgi:hypothetical protein